MELKAVFYHNIEDSNSYNQAGEPVWELVYLSKTLRGADNFIGEQKRLGGYTDDEFKIEDVEVHE